MPADRIGLGRPRPGFIGLGAAALAAFLAVALTRLTNEGDTPSPVPFILILLTIGLILVREHAVNRLSLFSPLAIVLLAFAVLLGLVPLADLWFRNAIVYHSGWSDAAWLAWTSLLLLYAGYRVAQLASPDIRRPVRSEWFSNASSLIALVLLAIAVGSVLVEIGAAGGLVTYFSRFARRRDFIRQPVPLLIRVSMATPAILLVAGNWLDRPTRRRAISLLLLWLPVVLVASGFLGQRWRAITVLVALLALGHLGYRRLKWPVLALVVTSLVAGFLAVNLYRNVVGTSRDVRSIAGSDFYYNYLSGHELGQFRDFVTTLEGVPGKLDFQHGRTFLSIIPGTSFPTAGYLYSSTFTPKLYAAGTSVSNSLLGELYMNFGAPGVLIGMLLFGVGMGLLESWFRRNRGRIGALLIYSATLIPLAGILRGDFTTFAGFTLLGLVALLIGLRFAERTVPDQAAEARETP